MSNGKSSTERAGVAAPGDPGDRIFYAALDAASELGRLVRAGVLSEDNPAVAAAVVVADGLLRIRAGEPAPTRTEQSDADVLLAGEQPARG